MRYQCMAVRNRIKNLVDGMNKTRYQFWKDTNLAQNTAYRLYDDPDYVPGPTVMDKICRTYPGVQPGDFIVYIPDEDLANTASSEKLKEQNQNKDPDTQINFRDRKHTRSLLTVVPKVPESA